MTNTAQKPYPLGPHIPRKYPPPRGGGTQVRTPLSPSTNTPSSDIYGLLVRAKQLHTAGETTQGEQDIGRNDRNSFQLVF